MSPHSLEEFRREAAAQMVSAHVASPLIARARNAISAKELLKALREAKISIKAGSHRNDLDELIRYIEANAPR